VTVATERSACRSVQRVWSRPASTGELVRRLVRRRGVGAGQRGGCAHRRQVGPSAVGHRVEAAARKPAPATTRATRPCAGWLRRLRLTIRCSPQGRAGRIVRAPVTGPHR
jgi:hypothetical protein